MCTKWAPPGVYFWKGIKDSSSSVTTESLPHLEFFPKSVKKGNNLVQAARCGVCPDVGACPLGTPRLWGLTTMTLLSPGCYTARSCSQQGLVACLSI